jgi:hypothetical protein
MTDRKLDFAFFDEDQVQRAHVIINSDEIASM